MEANDSKLTNRQSMKLPHRNNWQVNSTIADVADESLKGGGTYLQSQIWAAAQDTYVHQQCFRNETLCRDPHFVV
jgi:hypothetical protein